MKSDPIDKSRGFDAKARRLLKGLHQSHIDAIENLQPYNGVKWTRTLREISNPDKHRELVKAQAHVWTVILQATGDKRPLLGDRGTVYPAAGPNKIDTQVDTQHVIVLSFPNGPPVLQTLVEMRNEVRKTLDSFRSEFNV